MEVPKLLPQHPRRYALERCDEIGQGHLGRVVEQQMDVIVFAVELHQLGLEISANAGKNQPHRIQMLFPEHVSSIFCDEYQVNMKCKHTMPAVPQIAISLAWTCHKPSCDSFKDQ